MTGLYKRRRKTRREMRVVLRAFLATLILASLGLAYDQASALTYELRGQASAWLNHVESQDKWGIGTGASYIPQLTLYQQTSDNTFFDLEASLDALASRVSNIDDTAYVDLYRLKLRFASASTETRAGLQQINFGPAYLLRALRWFDVLDPRDPQSLTDGVYAATFKYVSPENSTIWLWLLYGNDEPKGYEMWPSVTDRVEYGGRAQFPLLTGEAAITYHHRVVDGPGPYVADFPEYRLGLDGRWDVVVGAWFETSLTYKNSNSIPYNYKWLNMTTLGVDYTFRLGNGLHTLLEHMVMNSSEQAFESGETSNTGGLSLSYPAGYVDRLSAISFYSWDNQDFSQYAAWDHYWTYLSLNVSLFYYPENRPEEPGGVYNPLILRGGYGGQVMLIFNH